jgi:hypothetical protein
MDKDALLARLKVLMDHPEYDMLSFVLQSDISALRREIEGWPPPDVDFGKGDLDGPER